MAAKTRMPADPLEQLRTICLALPEAVETLTFGDPVFRVRNKIFTMFRSGDGRESLWCKAAIGVQEDLVNADPKHFFVPPYVGHHGWVGVRLDTKPNWDFVTDLIERSYRMTAPKKLAARLALE